MAKLTDQQLAHTLARLGLGINIALHGFSRIPKFGMFAAHLHEQFAPTLLPAALVSVAAYGIVTAESVIGLMLLTGFRLRLALVGGCLLMGVLLFGTCLVQNWTVAGDQLVYLGFFAVLLATRRYSAWTIDGSAVGGA